LSVGTPAQERDFGQYLRVREDAQRLGMPLIVWSYPRGAAVDAKGGKDSFYAVDYAARTASELGADAVKVNFPHPEKESGAAGPYLSEFSPQQGRVGPHLTGPREGHAAGHRRCGRESGCPDRCLGADDMPSALSSLGPPRRYGAQAGMVTAALFLQGQDRSPDVLDRVEVVHHAAGAFCGFGPVNQGQGALKLHPAGVKPLEHYVVQVPRNPDAAPPMRNQAVSIGVSRGCIGFGHD
jgi:hypothetical protein